MATYGFSLGLVPVQAWIAEARRSRDLKAGSVFLWWTMAKVLAYLEEEAKARVYLPRLPAARRFSALASLSFSGALQEVYGMPNRATGYLEAADDEGVHQVMDGAEGKVLRQAWQHLKEQQCRRPLEAISGAFWAQLKEHWERYASTTAGGEDCPLSLVWAARAVPPDRRGPPDLSWLKEDLADLDRLYSEVKATRPVSPWRWGAGVGKCNQCGRREAMGPLESFSAWQEWERELSELDWVQRGYRVDAGERLCYVCLIRRVASYGHTHERVDFPSTGEVAAHGWLEQAGAEDALRASLEGLREAARSETAGPERGDVGRALYLSDRKLQEAGQSRLLELRRALVKSIRRLNRTRSEPLAVAPPRYLALLAFDGDDMGAHIHRDPTGMPERMNAFAAALSDLLGGAGRGVFYAAGDEGLLMLPAAEAVAAAQEVRRQFAAAFGEEAGSPTVSAGLAFFEESRPLGRALGAARESLAAAKALEGKSALGVTVATASGSRWRFVAPWGRAWQRIEAAVQLITGGQLAAGWAYDVESFLEQLPGGAWRRSEPVAAVRAEVERLFVRRLAWPPVGPGAGRSERRRALVSKREVWGQLGGPSWWNATELQAFRGFAPQQFRLIGFLARQAGGGASAGCEEG